MDVLVSKSNVATVEFHHPSALLGIERLHLPQAAVELRRVQETFEFYASFNYRIAPAPPAVTCYDSLILVCSFDLLTSAVPNTNNHQDYKMIKRLQVA